MLYKWNQIGLSFFSARFSGDSFKILSVSIVHTFLLMTNISEDESTAISLPVDTLENIFVDSTF